MTWSEDNGGSYKEIIVITKVRTLYPRGQGKNIVVRKLFTTVL
jgi:hypothetical protein